MLLAIREDVDILLADVKTEVAQHVKKGQELIAAADEKRNQREADDDWNSENDERHSHSGSDSDGSELSGIPRTPAGDDHRAKTQGLKSRVRETQVVQHKVQFLLGDIYNILAREKDEETAYGEADTLRKELLRTTEEKALRAMTRLANGNDMKKFDAKAEMTVRDCDKGGIKSSSLVSWFRTSVLNDA